MTSAINTDIEPQADTSTTGVQDSTALNEDETSKTVLLETSAEMDVNHHAIATAEENVINSTENESNLPKFRDLGLNRQVAAAVESSGYEHPTKIQAKIIPYMLEGRDVLAQSQTGSGKTAAFALPILSRRPVASGSVGTLVLAPTRELAMQVAKSFTKYAIHLDEIEVAAIYGGQDYQPQLRQLRRGAEIVVGTPGRIIDHVKRGTLDLSQVQTLVLDEADEMLNMGFIEDVEFLLQQTPSNRQVALFSATMPEEIRGLAKRYLNNPAKVRIKQKTMTAESVRQRALFVSPKLKLEVLARLIEAEPTDGVIVFTKTKDSTIVVAEKLCHLGFQAVPLNGDMPQKVRERTIQQLRNGKIDVLVATDVAARGLDVPRVSHVINFDLPHDSESYVHRIGRTGRAGRSGEAILLLSGGQRRQLYRIEQATKQKVEIAEVPAADVINVQRIERFKTRIAKTAAETDLSLFESLITQCAEETGLPIARIAAALAQQNQGKQPFLVEDLQLRPSKRDRDSRRDAFASDDFDSDSRHRGRPPRGRTGPPRPGMTRFRIAVGHRDRVRPGHIVGAIANEGGIDGQYIGPLQIFESFTLVDLPDDLPGDIQRTLQRTRVAGRPLKLRPDTGAPPRSGKPPRFGKSGGGKKSFKGKAGGRHDRTDTGRSFQKKKRNDR
ncbi:MAG: DEAD/DEAH box helicase [Planctomycetota bacterium]